MHGAVARHLHNLPSESPVRPGTHCASSALTPLVQAREAGAPDGLPGPTPAPRTLPRCRFRERSLPAVLSARESPPSVLAATSSSRPGGSGRFLHGDVRPRGCTGAASPRVRSAPILPFLPFCLVRRAFSVPVVPSAASAAARVRAPRGQCHASRRRHLQGVAVFARGCHGHSDASTGTEALSSAGAPTSRGASRFQGVILHRMIMSTLTCISQVLNVCYTEHSTC